MEKRKNELLHNIENVHTTELGIQRIKNNMKLYDRDVVAYCKQLILSDRSEIVRKGKNWYVATEDWVITINAGSFTIITVHRKKL